VPYHCLRAYQASLDLCGEQWWLSRFLAYKTRQLAESALPVPPLTMLPLATTILAQIFAYLDHRTLLALRAVCKDVSILIVVDVRLRTLVLLAALGLRNGTSAALPAPYSTALVSLYMARALNQPLTPSQCANLRIPIPRPGQAFRIKAAMDPAVFSALLDTAPPHPRTLVFLTHLPSAARGVPLERWVCPLPPKLDIVGLCTSAAHGVLCVSDTMTQGSRQVLRYV
jgi:hypothetical protein